MPQRASNLLTRDAAGALRADLKCAMTEVASGRAGVPSLLHQIERVAKYAAGDHNAALGWSSTKDAMRALVKDHASYALENAGLGGMRWCRLYEEVKNARNDVMHTGTQAVLAEARIEAMATVLLEALLGAAKEDGVKTLAHVMVEHPVCVHRWQTIADVRRTMLVSDFSIAACRWSLGRKSMARADGRRSSVLVGS